MSPKSTRSFASKCSTTCQPQGTTLTHSQFLSRRVKDAIVDRFRDVFRKRPNVNPQQPDLAVHAFLDQERCTLSIDSSGAPLFMRGYREGTGVAPDLSK